MTHPKTQPEEVLHCSLNEYVGRLDKVKMKDVRNGSQICNTDEEKEAVSSRQELTQL